MAWDDSPDIHGDLYIQMDVKDSSGIIAELERLGLEGRIDGAVSSIDLAAPTVNAINRWCGNRTMPVRFDRVLSKDEMRDLWMSAGIFNRLSVTDDEITTDGIMRLNQRCKLIVKPNISASSRGITIIDRGTGKDLVSACIEKARQTSFDGRFLVEEFVEGEEFTVDLLGDSYGNVCCYGSSIQYHSRYSPTNHVTVIHHWNSGKYDDDTWSRVAAFGIQCYKALGLHSMFGHLEIIMKADGSFTPVEMGARSSGFICSHTVSAASGHDYLRDYIDMLHGGRVEHGHYLNGPVSSMWFGYDIPSGSFSVTATDITRFLDPRITILFENHDGLKAGCHYGDYIDDEDRDKFGYAILTAPRDILTYSTIEEANRQFLRTYLNLN